MLSLKSICVYCGSSNRVADSYRKVARDFGEILAKNKIQLVYGGGRLGLMGEVADAAIDAGGYVIGYMTKYLDGFEVGHKAINELYVVDTMHLRKQHMYEKSDAFVVLPGGFGTLDEAFEILTWKQIGEHDLPIVFLNYNNYWEPLKALIAHMVREDFATEENLNLFHFVDEPSQVLETLKKAPPPKVPLEAKWL